MAKLSNAAGSSRLGARTTLFDEDANDNDSLVDVATDRRTPVVCDEDRVCGCGCGGVHASALGAARNDASATRSRHGDIVFVMV
jgi:hypothetical protein